MRKSKIACFSGNGVEELENKINKWLDFWEVEIVDIKFNSHPSTQGAQSDILFALVVYKE